MQELNGGGLTVLGEESFTKPLKPSLQATWMSVEPHNIFKTYCSLPAYARSKSVLEF